MSKSHAEDNQNQIQIKPIVIYQQLYNMYLQM